MEFPLSLLRPIDTCATAAAFTAPRQCSACTSGREALLVALERAGSSLRGLDGAQLVLVQRAAEAEPGDLRRFSDRPSPEEMRRRLAERRPVTLAESAAAAVRAEREAR